MHFSSMLLYHLQEIILWCSFLRLVSFSELSVTDLLYRACSNKWEQFVQDRKCHCTCSFATNRGLIPNLLHFLRGSNKAHNCHLTCTYVSASMFLYFVKASMFFFCFVCPPMPVNLQLMSNFKLKSHK